MMIMVWEWITLNMLRHDFLNYFVFYDMGSNGDMLLSSSQFDLENNLLSSLLLSMSCYKFDDKLFITIRFFFSPIEIVLANY